MTEAYKLIDWGWLLRQIPWVLGLSIVLAGLSWGHWEAMMSRQRHRDVLGRPGYRLVFSLGLALVSLGLALNPTRWWEPYLWGVFTLYFIVEMVLSARARYWSGPKGDETHAS